MLARLPSLILIRFCAVLLLATVMLQAGQPARAPLEQRHGSAFSATTFEVALAVSRNERSARQELPVQSEPPALVAAAIPVQRPVANHGPLPAVRPDSTGPPPHDIRSWRPAPRAPPFA